MSSPLDGFEFKFLDFKGLSATSEDWISFGKTTVIVGRNNAGKSAVLHALNFLIDSQQKFNPEWNRHGSTARFQIRSVLTEKDLAPIFLENHSGGEIRGSHGALRAKLVGERLTREFDTSRSPRWIEGPALDSVLPPHRESYQSKIATGATVPRSKVFGISAERNVAPELERDVSPVQSNGSGLTNLVRAFLYHSQLPMCEIEEGLLGDLNHVFESDYKFDRITCQKDGNKNWEIFLFRDGGGPVRLTESGSSLQSIFIILATIRLNPQVDRERRLHNCVFYIEEPENNLHPALIRRLLGFLQVRAEELESNLIITTHSPTAIDWASRRDSASIYHVRRGNEGSTVGAVREYRETRRLIEDLDVRASEILQANGVIWVEGPSDRIYMRRWIDIKSAGKLIEGQHYSIMFYGGRLLSHLSLAPPDQASKAIQLLRMNRNLALIMDSDRRLLKSGKFRSNINDIKRRIRDEAQAVDGFIWMTQGREIENYISDRVLQIISPKKFRVGIHESVPEITGKRDKVSLADRVVEECCEADLSVLDLDRQLSELCLRIERWNFG